jgi:hypothetical protein
MIDVSGRIAAALQSRSAHQDSIDRLCRAWDALSRCVDTLTGTMSETSGRIAGLEQRFTDGLTTGDSDWKLSELQQLRVAIAEVTPDLAALQRRFHRTTVNIGVVGRVAAGKSTLLRTISGLDDVVIPSGDVKPTTAARSRIQHAPGRADARVILRDWDQFRDGYLEPLHTGAECKDPVPATPDGFSGYPYQRLLDTARDNNEHVPITQPKFLGRLRIAQDSLPSYRHFLEQPQREYLVDKLADLRPFVAYPADDSKKRPYHAVHDVWIYCEFTVGDVENLVLVDLPGAGEAALNIEQQFLADLRNEVDVLLQVKRPVVAQAFIGEDDWRVLELADKASMGVAPADFIRFVINTDPKNVKDKQRDNAVTEARALISEPRGVRLLVGDVASPDEVRQQILGPVLEDLAQRLAVMDATAAAAQVARARAVAERVQVVAGRLASEVRRRQRRIPDENMALASEAKQLRNATSRRLDALLDEYDRGARAGESIPELADAIAATTENLKRWADTGFGMGSQREWIDKVDQGLSADLGETRDDQCTRARRQIRAEFGRIDSSLTSAIDRLHAEVAAALPARLIGGEAGSAERPLAGLLATAERLQLESLCAALSMLLDIRASYGNIFLRVGGPIVDRVAPGPGPLPGEGAAPGTGSQGDDRPSVTSDALYRGGQFVADVVGVFHPPAGPAAHAAARALPVVLGWIWEAPISDKSAVSLNQALSRAFATAVSQIEQRMRDEAGQLSGVLAAALNQFKDDFIRAPDIEREWTELCRPVMRELWPHTFGGETATLIAGYGRMAEAVAAADVLAADFRAAATSMGLPDVNR